MEAPRWRPRALLWLLIIACIASGCSSLGEQPKLRRMDARNWAREAKQQAANAAKTFLEQAGESLLVPVDVDVFLIGFDGGGGYGHKLEAAALANVLASGLGRACPHSLESGDEIGVCFHVNYQVMGGDELGDAAAALLSRVEAHLKANLRDAYEAAPWLRPRPGKGSPAPAAAEYTADAAALEPLFDAFVEGVYGARADDEDDEKGHTWHTRNALFVVNPSKVRLDPKGGPEAAHHKAPDFLAQWAQGGGGNYDGAALDAEEAGGFVYRYSYGGVGEAAAWLASRGYAVIDVAAGPSAYGPVAGRGGAVTADSLPALRGVYRALLADLRDVGPTLTAQQHAQAVARHAQHALFEGALAAAVAGAARALFAPDVATERLEAARNVLVPVVLLTDYELTEDDYSKRLSHEDFMGVNLTAVERAVARLLDPRQEAVVVSAHHPLSRHKQLLAALWKARRTRSEPVLDGAHDGARLGYHAATHASVDAAALLEELALAADTLTHGLVGAAHAVSRDGAHPLEQLHHGGTRVVPVFVLSLEGAPDDLTLFADTRDVVAAAHDAVLVLQPRYRQQQQQQQQGGGGGSGPELRFTGHAANGRRVLRDARDVTRHVVAGLATALAGVVPPYSRPLPPGHAAGPPEADWRWAVGATPFGPYSNYSGVSDALRGAARRNLLLASLAAALREAQASLDGLDAFVAAHFLGPWAAAGLEGDAREGRRHFLDTVASTRHGFATGVTEGAVAALEGAMGALTGHLQAVAADLYAHDFDGADRAIRGELLPAAGRLCSGLNATVEEAAGVLACCRARRVSRLGRLVTTVLAAVAAFAVVFAAAVAAVVASGRRRRSDLLLRLPTSGLGGGGGGGGGGAHHYYYSQGSGRPASRTASWGL